MSLLHVSTPSDPISQKMRCNAVLTVTVTVTVLLNDNALFIFFKSYILLPVCYTREHILDIIVKLYIYFKNRSRCMKFVCQHVMIGKMDMIYFLADNSSWQETG